MTKSGIIVLSQDNDHPISGQVSPCLFLTKPTRPPRSSNTQGVAWPHLFYLWAFCAFFALPHFSQQS